MLRTLIPNHLRELYNMCNGWFMDMEHVKSHEARRSLRDLLSHVERGGFVEIQRYDRPTAVMVPPDWFARAKALMEDTE